MVINLHRHTLAHLRKPSDSAPTDSDYMEGGEVAVLLMKQPPVMHFPVSFYLRTVFHHALRIVYLQKIVPSILFVECIRDKCCLAVCYLEFWSPVARAADKEKEVIAHKCVPGLECTADNLL